MEEPHNNHETPGRQTKQSNQLSLTHQGDCKTKMDIKFSTTKLEQLQTPTMGVTINNRTTALERTAAEATGGGGGLNAFYWYQIFALDSAVVEVQEMFSSHGSLLTIAMYHH